MVNVIVAIVGFVNSSVAVLAGPAVGEPLAAKAAVCVPNPPSSYLAVDKLAAVDHDVPL